MLARRRFLCVLVGFALSGCDGQDPDRLNRVGKKLAERGQRVADDAHLPKVSVTYPATDSAAEKGRAKPHKAAIPLQDE